MLQQEILESNRIFNNKVVGYYRHSILVCFIPSLYIFFHGNIELNVFLFQWISVFVAYHLFCTQLNTCAFKSKTYILIFLYCSFIHLLYYLCDVVDIPDDSVFYLKVANGIRDGESLINGIQRIMLSEDQGDASDYGYLLVVCVLFKYFGAEFGSFSLIILKYACHIIGCKYLYKLGRIYFSQEYALIATLLWAFNSYTIFWSVSFLKESIFASVNIVTIYYFCRYFKEKKFSYLYFFLLFGLSTFFFRFVFPIYYIIAFITRKYLYRFLKSYSMILCIAIGLGFTYIGTSLLESYFPFISGSLIERSDLYDSKGSIFIFLNIINPFVSPFPAIKGDNMLGNLTTIQYSIVNAFFSIPAIVGIFLSMRNNRKELFPLITILTLNSMMLIIVGYSMNARFTYPLIFIQYLFMPYGLQKCRKLPLMFAFMFIFFVTIFYNLR